MSNALMLAALLLAPQQKVASCCGMEQFANDPAFLAIHLRPREINFTATTGKTVTYNDAAGKATSGFLVAAKGENKSAVIMVHEFWGLNDNIRQTAEWLNEKTGYAVLAVDLYEGKTSTDAKVAAEYMKNVDAVRGKAIVKGAVSALRNGWFDGFKASKIGAVGFCFGGGWAFQTGVQGGADVDAVSVFYGMPDTSDEALAAIKAPVIFHHPNKDRWITSQVAEDLATKLKARGKSVTIYDYDADHAFANPSNPRYDKASADLAWERTLALFKSQLG